MKLNPHQKRKIKNHVFTQKYSMNAPTDKMVKEDAMQHGGVIMEWEWFNLEYEGFMKQVYKAIEEVL